MTIGIGVLVLTTALVTQVVASNDDNVTICHKNNGNGWSKITVDDDAVNGLGNGDHNTSQHQNGQDIIPPGSWDQNGRNWDAEGQAIYRNDCNVPDPYQTPYVTPYETPYSTPYETPYDYQTPPDPGPDPYQTPPYQNPINGNPAASECPDKEPVAPPKQVTVSAVVNGSLTVQWIPVGNAEKANVFYQETGTTNWFAVTTENDGFFTINALTGDSYYVKVQQLHGCAASEFTGQVLVHTPEKIKELKTLGTK